MDQQPKKRRAPAFQFYADDFIAGTADMSAEEVGGYMRLLCHQWAKGGIPNDPDRAGRIAGLLGSPSLAYVLAKFTLCEDGQLRNERMEQIRRDQAEWASKQAESGKRGAKKRWSNGNPNGDPIGNPNGQPIATPMANGWQNDSSPSPSPSPDISTHTPIRAREELPVELPHGFPKTADEAVDAAGFVGCPREFAVDEWHRAVGRGGRDSKDIPVRSWANHLRTCWTHQQNRTAERSFRQQQQPQNRRPIGTSTPDDAQF